jgi:hypothetical protein
LHPFEAGLIASSIIKQNWQYYSSVEFSQEKTERCIIFIFSTFTGV